jgi:hypothetical protein
VGRAVLRNAGSPTSPLPSPPPRAERENPANAGEGADPRIAVREEADERSSGIKRSARSLAELGGSKSSLDLDLVRALADF